jgi:eukaryotic-like serine/threonine-protein kinase
VCDAVQYAHRRRIVHRDLTPGNILVTEPDADQGAEGQAKLLDFGIAKLLAASSGADAAEPTRPGLRLLTPEYASPEQVRGEAVTPAADVYALGVLLYRLLCGRHPYPPGGQAGEGIERPVLETRPQPPSAAVFRAPEAGEAGRDETSPEFLAAARGARPEQLQRRLRGDLDAIVLRAMSKEPEQRYASAGELGVEVRRHLQGQRVRAWHEARLRRKTSLLLRRRRGVAAAAAVGLVAVSGYLATTRPAGLDEALSGLSALNERLSRVVECRFFGGLTAEETAAALQVTTRTVERDWKKARAWLYVQLQDQVS